MKNKVFTLVMLITVTLSCTKSTSKCEDIVGKWTLLETFDGYVNGGNFRWTPIRTWYIKTIELKTDYTFVETTTYTAQPTTTCSGTYTLQDSSITLHTSCNTYPLTYKITSKQCKEIIMDYGVREGVMRFKYTK